MPTSEPDPEAQRQPSVPTYAAALLLSCAYQHPTFAVRFIAAARLLATYLFAVAVTPCYGCNRSMPDAALFSPTQTRLRSDSGMDF